MGPEWMQALWLLLPVAALSGWIAARRGLTKTTEQTSSPIPPEYLKGLNYVLNEQPDKAIELFIKMLEVDSDTVETHLALGNLFRRRGEVDRAIRIHQNLIARPALSHEQRSLALLELGMDYMRSGLFDRAEGLFKELLESDAYTIQALTGLLDIYQQEKDWHECITIARRLQSISGERLDSIIAQFYCELASDNLSSGKNRETRDNLKRALQADSKCVRASLIEAGMARDAGKFKTAIRAYKRIAKQDAEYLPEIIGPMFDCYRELDRLDEYMMYLKDVVENEGGITPLLYLTKLIEEIKGQEEAARYISAALRKRPTVRGVDKLVEYALTKADGEMRESLQTIKDMTGKLLENKPVYKCNNCGFDAKLMHWYCPSCKKWNTIKPVHGVEGE
ncbi:MAG: lipopolysaccharide assembly protein LapB [Gammaproteobacteria bacterium]